MPRTVTVRAPGKVNLQLSVGSRMPDGYHPLVTVFQAVSLFETVTATVRDDEEFTLTVEAGPSLVLDPVAVPLDESNLAWRAALAVAERYGISDGIDLTIVKGVPVAGGMAGGSADAAAAVVACAEAWEVGASREELERICVELGADVPFCLHGNTAVGVGRGDELSPAMTHGEFHWVLATQSTGLSTPSVFAEFDRAVDEGRTTITSAHVDEEIMAALMAGDAVRLGEALSNDLQGPALTLAPHLQRVIDAAKDAEALGVVVSGSGPTVAALARSRQHALAIAAHLTAEDVADTVLTASGPVPGATVLLE